MLSTQNPPSSSSSDPPPSLFTTNEIHHKLDPSSSNFSIRDYVFSARSKDIKKNWPFSSKNLQLCLKHGLNNPLPPFQHLPVAAEHHVVLDSCNNHAQSGGENQNQNENDFPSTTTSVSQSEIDSVLVNKPSITSVVAPAVVVPLRSRKSENTARSSSKKCKLIVKFGANSTTEDIGSNSSMVSESMASKVCPVCKTFSSSSNTTLNAHIDQCLSGEPTTTSKWIPDSSKLITTRQHNNKPRKTRLMVDIYTTAKHCTLEELDKRNGTNWATMSTMPISNDDLEVSDQGKKRTRAPFVNREDDGAVYIDASGTKVRILSKLNEEPSVLKDLAPKKTLKGSKFFSNKKKRLDVLKKRLKHLKHATTQRSKLSSPRKVDASKMVDEEEEYRTPEGSFKDMERNGIQSTCSGSSSEKRACSKRSGPPRKAKFQDSYQPLLSGWRVHRDSPANGEHAVKKHGVDKLKELSETSFSAPEGTSKGESSPGRKRVRSPLSKGGHFMHENCPSSFSNKKTGIDTTSDPDFHPGNSFGFPSKARSKKSLLSVNRKLPVVDSPTKKKRQLFFLAEINEERQDDETVALKSSGPESEYDDPEEGEDMDSSVREDDNDDIRDKGDSFESVEEIDACPSTSAEPSDPSRSRSLQAVDEYSRPFCGDGALPDTIGIFSGDEVGPDPVGNADGKTDLMDDSFPEVDPIPIPGPPGSFLPSPRDMSSDDFPGNSSLTTSRVQSSQDQLELVDGDCSESPLSAASTISNPSSARFDLRYSESFGPPTVDNKSVFSSSSKAEPRVEDAVQTSQIGAEKSGVVRRSLVEKRPPFNFRNVDQPCCCQRKEKSSSQTSISMLDYQQSPLLIKRRAMTSGEMLHIGGTRPGAFSSRSLGGPENVVVQEIRPPPIVVKEKGRFDGGGACSPSSTTTTSNNNHNNPVLRLMGKNLMVVNKEKEELSSRSNHLSRSGSVQSECYGPFHGRVVVEDSSSFGQQHNNSGRYLYHHPGPGAGADRAVVVKGEIPPGAVFLQEEQCMEQEEAYYYNNNYISPSRRDRAHKAKLHGLELQQQQRYGAKEVVVVLDDDEVGAMPQQQYKASRHVENNVNMSCYYGGASSYSQEQEQPRHFPFPSGGGSGNEAQAGSPLIRPIQHSRWGGVSGQSSSSMYYYYSPHT